VDQASKNSRAFVHFPPQYALDTRLHGNPIRWLLQPGEQREVTVGTYRTESVNGLLLTTSAGRSTLVVGSEHQPTARVDDVLVLHEPKKILGGKSAETISRSSYWIRPAPRFNSSPRAQDLAPICSEVLSSWADSFSYLQERQVGDHARPGLRAPQIGAIHAAMAHWSVSDEIGTIVMPTGTGKTETMLSLLVCAEIPKLLVVVPTEPLRQQTAAKFERFGLLKDFGVIAGTALYPIVTTLMHVPTSAAQVDDILNASNVVVTTASVVGRMSPDFQQRMTEHITHLFIDEAHHVRAQTWATFRDAFRARRVLQFTATPFRRDHRLVDGVRVFSYPMRKAQEENYFKRIQFQAVTEFSVEASDRSIAKSAVEQLRADLNSGLDHIVMARTGSISRAKKVHEIYQQLASDYSPQIIHNKVGARKKREALAALRSRSSRVVVCVDMLGEGFDFPELKIAALHDPHRSLAVTLQFTGRFTRTSGRIGDATVVANIADAGIDEALRDLYEESADWNVVLRRLSEGATRRHQIRNEFLQSFGDIPAEIPIHNVFPKMSAVVFRTNCARWTPERAAAVAGEQLFTGPAINHQSKVLLYVTCEKESVTWGPQREPMNTSWHIYIAYWDERRHLLFINSSNNDSHHEDLARAIAGDDVALVSGEHIFRSLHGINRLMLTNMGLKHSFSRTNRFTMYVGSDVIQGLAEALLQNRSVTNVFGLGYANGARATIGCSTRGRIWSYRVAEDITEWMEWCNEVGSKLVRSDISISDILSAVLRPQQVSEWPGVAPIAIEWPDEFFERNYDVLQIEVDGIAVPFFDAELQIVDPGEVGPTKFRVCAGNNVAEYEIRLYPQRAEYSATSPSTATVIRSTKRTRLGEWFDREPPTVRFADGSYMEGNWFVQSRTDTRAPFSRDRIQAWNWSGVDLSKESQTLQKFEDSIQFKVIEKAKAAALGFTYDIIADDDGAGEIADVVAIAVANGRLVVHLFHCKYSAAGAPGARVGDLYEVCGQAQKSVAWKGKIERMIYRIGKRNDAQLQRTNVSRLEVGSPSKLIELSRMSRFLETDCKVFVVQPGMSKRGASASQLELLGATELYLKETFGAELEVIASE
jgi:superfamily II DNA or RNA helicase